MTKKEATIEAYRRAIKDGLRHEVSSPNQDGNYVVDPTEENGADADFVGTTNIRRAQWDRNQWWNTYIPLPKYLEGVN